jgi:signal peptidase
VIAGLLPVVPLVLLAAYHQRARVRQLVAGVASPGRPTPLWLTGGAWVVAGATSALVLALFVPYVLGGSSFTVMSGSMEPAIRAGDVVVDQKIRALDAKVGDVVTFRDPEGPHKLITHRVRRIRVGANGLVSFVTKGDNANAVQRWTVPANGSIGLVRARVPYLGYALWGTRQPLGRLLFVVVPALLLAASEIGRLWRPRPPQPHETPTSEPSGASPL